MTIIDKFKSILEKDERTFTYECTECGRVFETTTPSASRASCPNCEESRTRSVPGTSPE